MNLDALTDNLKGLLDKVLHNQWLGTAVTVFIVVVITAIVAHLVTTLIKRLLNMSHNPLPSLSIFVNIGRITVWCIGISIILTSCFGINVSAAITALGIGGIAISLGFQSTLSNLIGGLQIILSGIVKPGDHVKIGDYEGIVRDVTWRHTTINTTRGELVIIPNSNINTQALVKLAPETDVRVDVIVKPSDAESLDERLKAMEARVNDALEKITVVEKAPEITLYGTTNDGYRGLLSFSIGKGVKKSTAIDVALKSISADARKTSAKAPKMTMTEVIEEKKQQKRAHRHKMELARKRHEQRLRQNAHARTSQKSSVPPPSTRKNVPGKGGPTDHG